MDDKFCQALAENDRATLKTVFDKKLDTLNPKKNKEENYNVLKVWLESYPCVSSVEILPGMLRSNPPIKEFAISVKNDSSEVKIVNIGIQLFPGNKLKFNI